MLFISKIVSPLECLFVVKKIKTSSTKCYFTFLGRRNKS